MSLSPSKSDQLEETLESTRRSVRKLEIEAYRIRHDLTRLEAEYAYGLANGEIDNRTAPSEQPTWRSDNDHSAARTTCRAESRRVGRTRRPNQMLRYTSQRALPTRRL